MEENQIPINSTSSTTDNEQKGSNFWLWVVIVVIIIAAMFWFFKPSGEKMEQQTLPSPTPVQTPEPDEIGAFEIEDNPDVGVDDFTTLQTSQEPIN